MVGSYRLGVAVQRALGVLVAVVMSTRGVTAQPGCAEIEGAPYLVGVLNGRVVVGARMPRAKGVAALSGGAPVVVAPHLCYFFD